MSTILIVDDEEAICTLLKEFIVAIGHDVLTASDGKEGIERFNELKPDIIITDLNMPEFGGINLLKAVKSVSRKTPVLIMTGMPSVDAAVQCLKTGATDFLSKPIDFDHLERVISKSLDDLASSEGTLFMPTKSHNLKVAGYNVKRTLGVGNFGVVYLAEKPPENRPVALKVLKLDQLPDDSEASIDSKRRFSREAQAISQIRHPNIVEVYEYSVDMDIKVPFIAMEYVQGKTMKEMLPDLPGISMQTRADLIRQVALALEEIHGHGLCHRDVKPHNILVNEAMIAKVTDFGIVSTPDSQLTSDSNLLGTPAYMSPEAFFSAKVDHRADLFSLGIVAYEFFLGTRPFNGDSIAAIAGAIRSGRPLEPRKIDPTFPMALQDVLARLLKKDADSRYQSAREVANDLATYLRGDRPKTALVEYLKSRVLMRDWS